MTYAIVYSSRTGNTKLLADAIRGLLPEEDCVYYGTPDEAALQADRIYVGFWTDKGSCNRETAQFLKEITKQEVYLFGTAGFGGEQSYFDKVLHRTAKHLGKKVPLAGSFMCQGKMPMAVRQRYEKMLESPIRPPHMERMLENFDRALTHPDEKDLDRLRTAIQSVQ